MNNNISRRKLVAGAAWSAPAVLATTAVPAYASSTECLPDQSKGGLKKHENYAQELVWDVPADAKELHFEVTGAAGGSFSDDSTGITGIGGAGTTVKGIVRLNGTGKFTFIAGEGGGYNRGNSVNPGKGYGSGGAHGPSLTDRAGENAKEFFGPTGGGASAILFNNEPLVVAGAGGGAGILINQRSNDNQDLYWQMNEPIYGGSGGEKANAATSAAATFVNDTSAAIPANGGQGGEPTGDGGQGGPNPALRLPSGGAIHAESSQGVSIVNNTIAGQKGGKAGDDRKADGAQSSAQYSSVTLGAETLTTIVHSGTGGGGYGGGGSGSVAALAAYQGEGGTAPGVSAPEETKDSAKSTPTEDHAKGETSKGITRPTGAFSAGAFGAGGGAGGSYVDKTVENGMITPGENRGVVGQRIHGAIKFWYC